MSTNYENKMMTTKTRGVTVIILDDYAKRGGNDKAGSPKERRPKGTKQREDILKILAGK